MSVDGHSLPTGSRPERAGPEQTSPVPHRPDPRSRRKENHMAVPVADRSKALEAALGQIDRQFGKGSIMRMGDDTRPPVAVIPTGSVALDVALGGGGRACRRDVVIYGPESLV